VRAKVEKRPTARDAGTTRDADKTGDGAATEDAGTTRDAGATGDAATTRGGARARGRAAGPSVTETARRTQIIEAAIATIADLGYASASFVQIAARAGLSSTGLISYHFAGRHELIDQVGQQIVSAITAFMTERMAGVTSATDALHRYIDGNIAFIESHRAEMKALLEIFLNGGFHYDADTDRTVTSAVEDILRAGQASGEFRPFDVTVMATLIQRAIDGLPFLLSSQPGFDTRMYATEVVTAIDLATRGSR
jgi:AcrR family transcriptional regulator